MGAECHAAANPMRDSDEAERLTAKQAVLAHATTLATVLDGQEIAWEVAAQAMICGFEETFGVTLWRDSLSSQEMLEADRLTEQVYGNPDWTFRR